MAFLFTVPLGGRSTFAQDELVEIGIHDFVCVYVCALSKIGWLYLFFSLSVYWKGDRGVQLFSGLLCGSCLLTHLHSLFNVSHKQRMEAWLSPGRHLSRNLPCVESLGNQIPWCLPLVCTFYLTAAQKDVPHVLVEWRWFTQLFNMTLDIEWWR